uniref:Putative secreted protein n=1 Tax=Amblyomma triste TaxID=251400 RepID=A0A023GAK1_AMBTT
MMPILAIFLSMLAAAAADPSKNFTKEVPVLDIHEMTKVVGPLITYKRTHHTDTTFQCLSAMKLEDCSQPSCKYMLRARNGTEIITPYVNETVDITFSPFRNSRNHTAHYHSNYANLSVTLMLEMKDDENTCFVVWAINSDLQSGCELIVKSSALENISQDCLNYYETYCTAKSVELYKSNCNYTHTEEVPGYPHC